MHVPLRPQLRRAGWLLVFAAPLGGCGGCESEPEATGMPPRGVAAPATPTAPAAEPPPGPAADDPTEGRPRLADQVAAGATPEAAAPGAGARDLANELSRAVGTPTECFPSEYVTSNPGTLTVTVRARFDREGRASDVGVSAPGAPEPVRLCLERRAEAIRLPAPVPDAPRRVETSIDFALETRTVGGAAGGGGPPSPGMGAPTGSTAPAMRERLESPGGAVAPDRPPPSAYQLPPGVGEGGG